MWRKEGRKVKRILVWKPRDGQEKRWKDEFDGMLWRKEVMHRKAVMHRPEEAAIQQWLK